jgi:hypothetical protein
MKTKSYEKICRAFALPACVLLPVWASCDRLGNGNDGGVKTAVHFSVGDLESWDSETIVRGAPDTPRRLETVGVALEDGRMLEVDLMEDPAPATRAAQNLNSGAIMHVIARHATTGSLTEGDYVCQSDGSFETVSGDPMIVETGNYYFTAYSYNTTDNTASTKVPRNTGTTVTFSPYVSATVTNDLILATVGPQAAGGGVSLTSLAHQFSRVRYASTIADGTLSGLSASLKNNYTATWTKSTAKLTKSTGTTAQPLNTSNYRIVYTGGEAPVLTVSGTIDGKIAFNASVSYKTALAAGKSYTLRFNVKRVPWAGSNIYWNGSKLTFDAHGTRTKEMYQGVFFRWGSLVGIDPSYKGGVAWNTNSSTGNVLYTPTYNSTTPTSSTWSSGKGKTWSDANIPYTDDDFGYDPSVDCFALPATADYANKKGDICRYLSRTGAGPAGYRMPTNWELYFGSNDFSAPTIGYDNSSWAGSTLAGHWTRIGAVEDWVDGSGSATKSDGTLVLTTGGNYSDYTTFPASGFRGSGVNAGELGSVGGSGRYWSSSAEEGNYAQPLCLDASGLSAIVFQRTTAYPVRCIRQE